MREANDQLNLRLSQELTDLKCQLNESNNKIFQKSNANYQLAQNIADLEKANDKLMKDQQQLQQQLEEERTMRKEMEIKLDQLQDYKLSSKYRLYSYSNNCIYIGGTQYNIDCLDVPEAGDIHIYDETGNINYHSSSHMHVTIEKEFELQQLQKVEPKVKADGLVMLTQSTYIQPAVKGTL